MRRALAAVFAVLATIACHHTPVATTPAAGATGPGAARPASAVAASSNNGGQGAGALRVRRRPDPRVQDSVRRATVEQIARTIAGRENEPAGTVFKNVKLLRSLTAGELLQTMNESYARGLGWVCTNCHVPAQFDSDQRKNKRIARQMQELVNLINQQELPKIAGLDADYRKVSCVTCHRGSNQIENTMPVPAAAAVSPGRGS